MAKSTKGEQVTALISTIVAVVILAAGVTAHQTHSSARNRLAQREDDLRLQLDLALSHNRAAMKERSAQVDEVFSVWSHSQQSAHDAALLERWIDEAIVATMPGAVRDLPPAPEFSARQERVIKEAPLPAPRTQMPIASPPGPRAEPESPTASLESPRSEGAPQRDILDAAPTPVRRAAPGPTPTLAETLPAPNVNETAPRQSSPAQESLATTAPGESPTPSDGAIVSAPPVAADLLPTQSAPQPEVQVNLRRLHTQIERYNQALQTIDVSLKNRLTPLDEAGVEEFVERLAALASQHEFLRLYYDGLSPEQRVRVSKPRGLVATARRLHQQLQKLTSAGDGDFLRPFDAERQPVLQALDQRLREIAETTSR